MSAPSIPNLNTLRRGGLKGRGRGGVDNTSVNASRSTTSKDDIIRNTDNDAATSRLSAVEAGYLKDDFARLFHVDGELPRRLPLMNRGRTTLGIAYHSLTNPGTYVRTEAIDRVVEKFVESTESRRRQIISLGAGSDARYFRLRQRRPTLDLSYHELDFPGNTRDKITRIRTPLFAKTLKQQAHIDITSDQFEVLESGAKLRSADYCIHPQDLRQLVPGSPALSDVDPELPTLLISECCLIYLPPREADDVLHYFNKLFDPPVPLAIVIYEPIRPNDSFGRTMVSNLIARGIHLQTLEKYADLKQQRDRLLQQGFGGGDGGAGAGAADIDFIWKHWIGEAEKERVEGLEWMDEVEEFVLLARHYCIAWGWRGFEEGSAWRSLSAP